MSNNKKWSIAAVLIVLGCSVGVALLTKNSPKQQNNDQPVPAQIANRSNSDKPVTAPKVQRTIASEWQWQELGADDESNLDHDRESSMPFTRQSVHDALQEVRVDENGDIVLDHLALVSLDEALERIYNLLDGESLLELQNIIESALPGKVGQQTALLVGNYKGFLDAKDEFSQIHRDSAVNTNQSVGSLSNDQALYKELQDLREIHLGSDASNKLFKISNANAEFMFESMKLGLDNTLSDEERTKRHSELAKRHQDIVGEENN